MGSRRHIGLLLLAHGARGDRADNAGVVRLAAGLAARGVAAEVRHCFINGVPSVEDAFDAMHQPELLVYPLFLSDGYFMREVLARRLQSAGRRHGSRSTRCCQSWD
jgi:sirohydrochlorin ferrochelatase